nr:hypothetical protein [Chromobacterium sp. ASV5]
MKIGMTMALPLLPTLSCAQSMPQIEATLKRIPSAAHGTAWNAIQACHMKIDKQFSEMVNEGGDTRVQLLHVTVAVPPPTPEDARFYKDILLRWEIRNGKVAPMSNWAEIVQKKPTIAPWLGC